MQQRPQLGKGLHHSFLQQCLSLQQLLSCSIQGLKGVQHLAHALLTACYQQV
jgi:hypothetical protein